MEGAAAKAATTRRARHVRWATWAVALALSVGVVAIVSLLQIDSYQVMLGNARHQVVGSSTGTVRMLDQYIDASLGPLLALRNAVDSPDSGPLHARLAEVQARHPELPLFVALDVEGGVMASTNVPLMNWRDSLVAPRRFALGASVRVVVADGAGDVPPTVRVLVDSRVALPAAFGTLVDAARVRDGMRHSLLGATAAMSVFSPDGRPFASNRDDIVTPWVLPVQAPGTSGEYTHDGRVYAWISSARYPFVVLVSLDLAGIHSEWLRQARPSMLATLALVLLLNVFAALFDRAYRRQNRLLVELSRSTRDLGDAQRNLRSTETRFGMLFEQSPLPTWVFEPGTLRILAVNQAAARVYGYTREEMLGLTIEALRPPGEIGRLREAIADGTAFDDTSPQTWVHVARDGRLMHMRCHGADIEFMGRRARQVIGLDFTDKVMSDRELAASEGAYRQLLARMPLPLVIVRGGGIAYANLLAEERLGSAGSTLVGRDAADFMDADALEAIRDDMQEGSSITAWLNPEHGIPFEAELALSGDRDSRERGTLVIMRDLTEQRSYEERLNYQANHDELTGLPNRRALRERLAGMVATCVAEGSGLMVLFVDLDHFKVINDALGHALGDQVLRDVTLKLGDALGGTGEIGRFGGDEFVAMLPFTCSPAKALDILPRIQRAIEEPLEVAGTMQRLKCSIGVAFATRDGADADTLIRNADTAMYDAKRSGRHTWRCYSSEMHARAMARLNVLTRLSGVNLDKELALAWQTQHDGASGRVTGIEALLRWPSAPGGLGGNDLLVPLLEETGAIVQIGQWVLREACRQQRRVASTLGSECRIAVNISAMQLVHTDLVAEVRQALAETGASASLLELELTESAFMTEPERAIRTLHELRAMGVSIALDDFGTGYSNLTYLSRLPLDRIKIDRHFTAALLQDDVDASICRSIVFLARSLNLEVVAEGVETDCQRRWLLAEGCEVMQGYFFSRPVPLDALETA